MIIRGPSLPCAAARPSAGAATAPPSEPERAPAPTAREVPVLPVVLGAATAVAGLALAGSGWGLAAGAAGAALGGLAGHLLPRLLTPEGPRLIVGHVGAEEARLWGRGDARNNVMKAEVLDAQGKVVAGGTARLSAESGYTGVVTVGGLQPGQSYRCRVDYGDTRETGSFRTSDPQADDVSFLMGSCNNHRFWRRGEAWERIRAVADRVEPDFLLHTGDQIYADQPLQSHGLDGFRGCYRRAWSDDDARSLLKEHPNYMILDDHEVANGYAQDAPITPLQRAWLWLSGLWGSEPAQRESLGQAGMQAYAEFQHSHNPHPFGPDKNYYTFSRGPAEFFVMDTTAERDPSRGRIISPEQMGHLQDWLKAHPDKPKFVVSAVPFLAESTSTDPQSRWSSPGFRGQRDEVLDFVAAQNLKGVVFLSGDSHNSFHMETDLGTTRLHELGASPVNGWFLRGSEIYHNRVQDQTAAGTPFTSELDQDHFLGRKTLFSRDYSACMEVRTDGSEVEFAIHRTHRDDGGAYSTGRFSLGLPSAVQDARLVPP